MQIDADPAKSPGTRFIRLIATFCGLLGFAWLVFYSIWWSLPYIQAGHEQIYDLKLRLVTQGSVFPEHAPIRVAAFGDSRVLAGFNPDLFDELSLGRVRSYNLGLPNSSDFLDILEGMVAKGSSPTHALLVFPWSSRSQPKASDFIQDDRSIIASLFPFRYLPRDLAQFLVRSYQHGGIGPYYSYMQDQVEGARRDRGYFFIEHMSHFPNHSLPDDFKIESETPEKVRVRPYELSGDAYSRVRELSDRHGIQFIMIPLYHRQGQYGAPRPNEDQRRMLERHRVSVVGPDYWLYPNAFFADPTHLNRKGAANYTRQLWEIVGPQLLSSAAAGTRDESR